MYQSSIVHFHSHVLHSSPISCSLRLILNLLQRPNHSFSYTNLRPSVHAALLPTRALIHSCPHLFDDHLSGACSCRLNVSMSAAPNHELPASSSFKKDASTLKSPSSQNLLRPTSPSSPALTQPPTKASFPWPTTPSSPFEPQLSERDSIFATHYSDHVHEPPSGPVRPSTHHRPRYVAICPILVSFRPSGHSRHSTIVSRDKFISRGETIDCYCCLKETLKLA